MSVSGARPAGEIDLEDFEKRLRTAVSLSGGVEDPLAELARLVEASRPKGAGAPAAPPVAAAPPPPPVAPLESGALRPALDEAPDREPELNAAAEDASEAGEQEFEPYPEGLSAQPAPPPRGRPRLWLLTVSGVALAGIAMIGAVSWLKGGLPGISKTAPFIAAAQGPTKVQPPSEATVSTSNDGGANLLKDATQPNKVKVVNSEEQPVDLSAQTAPPPAPALAPPPATAAASAPADAAGGSAVRGTIDTPVVVAPPPSAPVASPFPEPKPVRTISLRPDGTPIPASATDAGVAQPPPSQEPPKPPAKPAAKAPADAASAQPSTPKIELPTKLSSKSSARVAVAKTDTTAPGGAPGEPAQTGAVPAKPAKGKVEEAAAEPAAPAAAESAATSSGGWAVQLAAPKSEAEAKSVLARLNEKYASALGGSALAIRKATVNGEPVYRVRATGLTKADAAALCARIKGDGGQCFVAK